MKTQISRLNQFVSKHYSGVYQQQGRMFTDADWNELNDIVKTRLVDALQDIVGSGIPRENKSGLNVIQDGSDGNIVKVSPGHVYVEGVPAHLTAPDGFDYVDISNQVDFPDFSGIPPAVQDYTLYLDVWDRSVTSIEDNNLLDFALHGADTCSRTQTMVQLKYAPDTLPLNDTNSPANGDAGVSLQLRLVKSSDDDCDPCASEVDIEERVGNYLFRVEVHNVVGHGNNISEITLKWSRENAAEQYAAYEYDDSGADRENPEAAPIGFDTGNWIYEFFNGITERNLGVHLPDSADFDPARSVLSDEHSMPSDAKDMAKEGFYLGVRRWDGCCTLVKNGSNWELKPDSDSVINQDMGRELAEKPDEDSAGAVIYDSGVLSLTLDTLKLKIELDGKQFVAGDFWLASIRESQHQSEDFVLGSDSEKALPNGIKHHYFSIAEVASGNLTNYQDPQQRRDNFPSLTDLQAYDVGYIAECMAPTTIHGLLNSEIDEIENVEDALKAILCETNASHIPLSDTLCPDIYDNNPQTVQSALENLCSLNAEKIDFTPACSGDTVNGLINQPINNTDDALKALLCQLQADHVPLDQTHLNDYFNNYSGPMVTVQDALNALCEREGAGGGCAKTVGVDGVYETLDEAFADFETEDNVWLCLLGNTSYQLSASTISDLQTKQFSNLKMTGLSADSCVISISESSCALKADNIILQDIGFYLSASSAQLELESNDLTVKHCTFNRPSSSETAAPMVVISGSDTTEVVWENNYMRSRWTRIDFVIDDIIIPQDAIDPDTIFPPIDFPEVPEEIVIGGPAVDPVDDPWIYYAAAIEVMKNTDPIDNPGKFENAVAMASNYAGMLGQTELDQINVETMTSELPESVTENIMTRNLTQYSIGAAFAYEASGFDGIKLRAADLVSSSKTTKGAASDFLAGLVADNSNSGAIADSLKDVYWTTRKSGYSSCLGLSTNDVGGWVKNNVIQGMLGLNSSEDERLTGTTLDGIGSINSGIRSEPIEGDLSLRIDSNEIERIDQFQDSNTISGSTWQQRMQGYSDVTISNNRIASSDSAVAGKMVNLSNNYFYSDGVPVFRPICERGMVTGNIGPSADTSIRVKTYGQSIQSNNLLTAVASSLP